MPLARKVLPTHLNQTGGILSLFLATWADSSSNNAAPNNAFITHLDFGWVFLNIWMWKSRIDYSCVDRVDYEYTIYDSCSSYAGCTPLPLRLLGPNILHLKIKMCVSFHLLWREANKPNLKYQSPTRCFWWKNALDAMSNWYASP